jgi:hypothetical protein
VAWEHNRTLKWFFGETRNLEILDPTKALAEEQEMADDWADHERSSPASEVYEKSLATQWQKTGCAADGAPYALRALLERLESYEGRIRANSFNNSRASPFGEDSPEVPTLAAKFLDKDCAGARGLSQAEIAKLKEIAAKAPPPAPKQ